MSKQAATSNSTSHGPMWDGIFKEFVKRIPKVSQSYDERTIFRDACRMFSLSLRGAVTLPGEEKERIETEYAALREKYGEEGEKRISQLLTLVVDALEFRRSDFLGHVYEALNATVSSFGQFFTPDSISKMMARCTMHGQKIEPNRIVKLSDPACGAGALLIEAAEEFLANGGRQADILIHGGDLDQTAADIAYAQLSLLGYPAVIYHMDSLSMKVYGGPWYTFGYFAHAMPMRLMGHKVVPAEAEADGRQDGAESPCPVPSPEGGGLSAQPRGLSDALEEACAIPEINVRDLVQSEFNF